MVWKRLNSTKLYCWQDPQYRTDSTVRSFSCQQHCSTNQTKGFHLIKKKYQLLHSAICIALWFIWRWISSETFRIYEFPIFLIFYILRRRICGRCNNSNLRLKQVWDNSWTRQSTVEKRLNFKSVTTTNEFLTSFLANFLDVLP